MTDAPDSRHDDRPATRLRLDVCRAATGIVFVLTLALVALQ